MATISDSSSNRFSVIRITIFITTSTTHKYNIYRRMLTTSKSNYHHLKHSTTLMLITWSVVIVMVTMETQVIESSRPTMYECCCEPEYQCNGCFICRNSLFNCYCDTNTLHIPSCMYIPSCVSISAVTVTHVRVINNTGIQSRMTVC